MTLVEIMVAATLLLFVFVSSLAVIQKAYVSVDAARNLPLASQLMQSELERLRLKNWDQLTALQNTGETVVTASDIKIPATLELECHRDIRDIRDGMKEITLISTWKGLDGRGHEARMITRYGKTGLNDYFYTRH